MTTQLLDVMLNSERMAGVFNVLTSDEAKAQGSDDAAFRRDSKLHQLDVNYRWSSIVYDERIDRKEGEVKKTAYGVAGQVVQAGDRAPDAPSLVAHYTHPSLPAVTRLFDIFKPDIHVALVFASTSSVDHVKDMLVALDGIPSCRKVIISPPGQQLNLASPGIADYLVEDKDGLAFSTYGVKVSSDGLRVVIVRPDAMVGAFAHSLDGVGSYKRILGLS